jgi:hypothetical protein
LVLAARALALLWAGFWLFFVIAESWVCHTPVPMALPWVAMGLVFLFLAILPWRWERMGGLLPVMVGLSAEVAYAIWSPARLLVGIRVLTTVLLAGPPLTAGIVFLTHGWALRAGG